MGGDDSQKLLLRRGGQLPLQGANLLLNYAINNVAETAAGISRRLYSCPVRTCPQSPIRRATLFDEAGNEALPPAWAIFGKHRWVNFGARRREMPPFFTNKR